MGTIKLNVSNEIGVATADIDSYAITTAKLNTNAVTSNEITAYNVTTVKINTAAVTANELASYAVTAVKIATSVITAAKISYTSILSTIDTVVTTVTHSLGASPSIIIFEPTVDVAGKDVYTSSKNATTGIFIAKTASWSGWITFIQ